MSEPQGPVAEETGAALPDAVRAALRARLGGSPLLLMLDVDGTLAPIAARPSEAVVPEATCRIVAELSAIDGVRIALVSGRAAVDARRLVACGTVWTIGNHGAEVLTPTGELTIDPLVAPFEGSVAQVARALRTLLAPLPQILIEDKGRTLSVHYRLADPALVPSLRAALEDLVRHHHLRLTEGKCVFEVRPPVAVDKGVAVVRLARELGALAPGASLLYVGDDATDEDAFRLLRARASTALTVKVGEDAATQAEFSVPDPDAVRMLLGCILASRGAPAGDGVVPPPTRR